MLHFSCSAPGVQIPGEQGKSAVSFLSAASQIFAEGKTACEGRQIN